MFVTGILTAVQGCSHPDGSVEHKVAKQPPEVEVRPTTEQFPDDVVWQPAVGPGTHALLGDSAEVVVGAVGKQRLSTEPELQAVIRDLLRRSAAAGKLAPLKIDYPPSGAIFPPEIVAPTFLWHESASGADTWLIDVAIQGGSKHVDVLVPGRPPPDGQIDPNCIDENFGPYTPTPYQASARSWTPRSDVWAVLKEGAKRAAAEVTIYGFNSSQPTRVLSRGQMTFNTSGDPLGAPIFYRDVPLMPSPGEKGVIKPLAEGAIALITWRLKDIARPGSRVVLKEMPTCANCHSFSADGKTLGMDVDGPTGDKGAYAVVPVEKHIQIGPEDVITWNSFPEKPPGHKTIGFLSQVSPDGQNVISTVNESLYVANFLDQTFLQVFYPTRGILAYYSRSADEMKALPGADDPEYVHCAPTWSPDGKYIVFCRAKAKDPYTPGRSEATRANDPAELPIQYDLCRIPFNGGRGGKCEPIRGASNNSMSNTFPKVSPNGKWIVFVKCRNGLLMRPDGKLWIVPAAGGRARAMRCNTWRMNSWHSFSPNGRWLVFSSKANTPFTQMFLTHLDEVGNDSPPILIPDATAANRAVNIPEFVNIRYDAMQDIATPAVEYFRHFNRGRELARTGRHPEAVAAYREALAGEPDDWRINAKLAESLIEIGQVVEAQTHFRKALVRNPGRAMLHNKMALALLRTNDVAAAGEHFDAAVRLDPNLAIAWCNRGNLRMRRGDRDGAGKDFDTAIEVDPELSQAWCSRGILRSTRGDIDGAVEDYSTALRLDPKLATAWCNRANLRAAKGDFSGAREDYDTAIELAPKLARAWFNRGGLRARQKDFDGALEDLSTAIRLDPRLPMAWCNRANLRMAQGDLTGAMEDYDAAIRIDPRFPDAWCNRGLLRKRQQDWRGAVGDFSRCLEVAPSSWPHRAQVASELQAARAKLQQGQ